MSDHTPDKASPIQRPTLGELFIAFAIISLYGFGGVLAWSRRMVVEQKRWMTPEEFNQAFAVCQFLPGPNVVNFSVVFGSRFRGAAGAVVALIGLIGPPMIIVTLFGVLYARYGELPTVQRMLSGVGAAAAGLVIGTVAKMARPLFKDRLFLAPLTGLAVFVAIGLFRWPIYWVLALLLPISIALAWWTQK
jgi:chromate transporter